MSKPVKNLPELEAEDLIAMLAVRFSAPAFAFLPQVPDGTGGHKTRTADAIALGLWPSRGMELHGFEVKVRRYDWIRELENPAKAEAICEYCDRYWLVVSDAKIVEPGELPATWGLLVPSGKVLRAHVAAPELKPKPVDLPFVCSILRCASAVVVPDAKLKAEYDRGRKEEEEARKSDRDYRLECLIEDKKALQKAIDDFKAASGVEIGKWSDDVKIGEAVKLVMNGAFLREKANLERLRDSARGIAEGLEEDLKKLDIQAADAAEQAKALAREGA